MNIVTYKRILADTIKVGYPLYLIRDFLKDLEQQELILIDKRKKEQEGKLNLKNFSDDDERVAYLLKEWPCFIKKFEEYEYKRMYRYCYLLKYESINLENLKEAISKNDIIEFSDNENHNDILHKIPVQPTYKVNDEKIYLKFSVQLDSKIENHDSIKHTILVIIYKNSNIIEIHQDTIRAEYYIMEKIYDFYVRSIKGWLFKTLELVSNELDLQSIIRYIKDKKNKEVKVAAVRLKKDGMIADLDSSTNPELQLPILDEIKDMLLQEIFDRNDDTRAIRQMFNRYIEQTELLSDMPSAKLFWLEREILIFVYGGEDENELQYFKWSGELKGGEEVVCYVTNYIRQCENELISMYDN